MTEDFHFSGFKFPAPPSNPRAILTFSRERELTPTLRFFRLSAAPDGGGGGTAREVKYADIRAGDTLLLSDVRENGLRALWFYHVTKIEDDKFYYIPANDFMLNCDGQDLIDRFAGLLGRVPTE